MRLETIGAGLVHGTALIGRRDTMLLLEHITGKNSAQVMLGEGDTLPQPDIFLDYVNRFQAGEPLQYIIGQWDFMGHPFKVSPHVLIPRPETELLVELALDFLATKGAGAKVLDLCTGSGCIAASIARAGQYHVTAADISPLALDIARENGEGLAIEFVETDLFTHIKGGFDLIISNPPYITTEEMGLLSPVVRDFEPHLALHGGDDGMDIYRKLVPQSFVHLNPGGGLFLEIGPVGVMDLVKQEGFSHVELKADYSGLPRMIIGLKDMEE